MHFSASCDPSRGYDERLANKKMYQKRKEKNRIANTLSKMAEIYETSCQQGKRFYTLATLGVSTSKTCRETLLSQITRPT